MATIIGGNGTGTLDTSLYQLNSNNTTGAGTAGDGEQVYINVSNGNLVLSHLDEFLPSETNNFLTTRTYNSQGQFGTPDGEGWTMSEFSRLAVITPFQIVVLNGDGSEFTFNYDADKGVYQSVDGAGAYETLSFNPRNATYSLTRSDQTVLTYDFLGRLVQSKDTNGNTISYNYNFLGQLASIGETSGHQLSFIYNFLGQLAKIQDETGAVFASYQYFGDELVGMTDRAGQTTHYAYYLDGTLKSMTLPSSPGEAARTLSFTYCEGPDGPLVSSFTDAQGNVTRFNYNFNVGFFGDIEGGTTTVTDAAGNATSYTFNEDSEITDVRDAQGNDTVYGYDENKNLTSVMDANGSAIVRSDSTYYRNLRQSFGIVDASGQGKLVSELTASDVCALQARYTTQFTYDCNGNLTSQTDGAGNVTTYSYTSFNKVASSTSAEGNALITSDAPQVIAKRQELGFIDPATGLGKTVAQLTAADKQAILGLYTTSYTYDSHQNLTQVQAPDGGLTRLAYDSVGNLTQKTVFLDSTNLTDPSKQETTQYFYDAFGNNIKTIDAQGNTTLSSFDHFGNKLTQVDGNGGVTRYQYDAENRVISTTDPLGNTTFNFYDAVGNRIAVEDAAGHTTTYLYNADNLLITVIDPAVTQGATRTRVTQYTYDVMGNRTRTTDANGNTTTYTYDALNRELTATTPTVTDASGNAVAYTTRYAYDAVGNRISVIDNNGNRTDTVYNSSNLVSSVTDADGLVTQYAYDADLNQVSIVIGAELAPAARQILKFDYDQKDRLINQTDALGNTTRYAYDGADNRIAVTDANGNTTNYTYDRDNRLLTVTQPGVINPTSGQSVRYTTQYQYDANGNQVAVTDQDGHTTLTTFDKDNRAVLIKDPNGIQTVYTYDSRGNRTSVQIGVQAHVSANGTVIVDSTQNAQVETVQYDEFNQVIATTDGVGNALVTSDSALYTNMRKQLGIVDPTTGQGKLVAKLTASDIQTLEAQFTERYTYDRDGNYTSTTDHLGRTTSLAYDALNRLVDTTDALGGQTKVAYDGNGNVVSRTDALGRKTTSAYDSMNRLVDTTDALGVDTHRTYDAFGNLTSSTAAIGTADARTTSYVYDLDNRVIATTDPQANTQTYTYDAVGNRLQVTDAKGQVTRYVYDALNRNIAIIDPLGFQTRMTYDGVGNKLSLIDPKGGVTSLTYDAGNREISMQDAMGRVTTYTYDVLGDRVTQTTAAGTSSQETTTYVYDAESNLRQVTDAAGNVSTQNYDAVYNLASATDANGHTTTYSYDALNREIQVTNAAGGVTRYAYDAVGNRLSVTDANGHVTTYAYDARNQMIAATDANGVETTYAYDSVGNQVRITYAANTSAAATTMFAYNLDNKLVSQTDALGHTQTFQVDADGNLIATTDALGHTTTYTFDADNQVTSITDPLGNVTRYRYDANGNRVQVIDARGFASTTYYNADNEVSLSVDNDGYATSSSYDANGNLVSQTLYSTALTLPLDPTVQPTPVTSASDRTTLFGHDALNRLVSRTDGEGYVTQFVYDAVGNRIGTRQALDRAGTQFEVTHSYYDAVNRRVASVTAQGYLTTYTYDAAGNPVSQTQYDQIVSVPTNGSVPQPVSGDAGRTTTAVYDADNRLIQQTNALGMVTTYQYDARGNRIAMTEGAGTANARTTTYAYDAADRYIATTNALGITTALVLDADGNVLTRYEDYGTTQQRAYTFKYDANNQVVSQTDPLGVTTLSTYDAVGNVVSQTVAAGSAMAETSTSTYDGDGRRITSTDALGTETTAAYDAAGNQIQVTEAVGLAEARTNTFVYDRSNRLVSAADALGTVTTYQYDGAGNRIFMIQAAGTTQQRQSAYSYDLDNRVVQVTDPMGAVTQYQYDAQGNRTKVIDANGGVEVNTFDAMGHALTSLSAAGVLLRNTYDLFGNLTGATLSFADGSDARTNTYAYDLLNRQIEVTDGEGFSTSITYDDFGNQLSVTRGQYRVGSGDPSYSAAKAAQAFPQTNTLTYDADNHVLSMTDGVGNVTSYQYDAVGNRISTTDGNGHTTQFSYDLLNRVVQTTTPAGGVTCFSYDQVGNQISQSQLQSGDPVNGVWATTTAQYDADGRRVSQTDPMGVVTQFNYDAMGNLLSQTAAAGTGDARTVRMEYDLDNRKIADIDALGNRKTYAYDAMGNRIQVTDALGSVTHYYYNGDNQNTEVVDSQGLITTLSYDAAGNRIQTVVHMTPVTGGVNPRVAPTPVASSLDRITTDQYDRADRLIRETAPDGSITQYRYDGVGNKVSETQFANTSAPRTMTFTYDADSRLVSFTDVDGSVTSFTYDKVGNKLSQTITSASDPNPTRATTYTYDANNRELSETFDPSGLSIIQSLTYDHLGNVLTRTDGNGHTVTFTYDLNNRQLSQTDSLGNTATFAYDRVGNKIAATDGRGNTTNTVYDADNRVIQEIRPQVQIYTVSGGSATVRPTITHVYDANGNEIQTTDASGNVTTRYYDGDSRLIAQVSADDALTTYTYNAAGDKTSQTLYMTRLGAGSYDPSRLPSTPVGDSQLITYTYDLMGRVTLTTYPAAQITTLVNTNTNNPSAVTVTEQVTERSVYDAYGNLVESFDKNGNETLSYYDVKGNRIATVDAAGYLTEWSYDEQGNVLEQRVYTQALDLGTLSPGTLPTPPAGEVDVTDRQYDAASRLIKETDPQIATFDPNTQTTSLVRPTTTYTYDKAGNQLTRTRGVGTAQAVTEYSYYDADNRRVAVVDDARVLSTYSYDANGNLTAQQRYINPVAAGVDLTQLNGATSFAALVSADSSRDEATDFTYDALNRVTQQSDLMSSGPLTKRYGYDAVGNKTSSQDEDGYFTRASFDGMGRLVESISPDGSGTQYEYDAAGNQILVYTGVLTGGAPTPATNLSASLDDSGSLGGSASTGNGVSVTWNTQGSATHPVQTWVVYDTTSHTNIGDYAKQTATQVSANGQGLASIASSGTSGTLYFRVVTEDGYGNKTWTAEQSITIPPSFSAVSVSQPDASTIVVTAHFDAGAVSPQLVYGSSGHLSQSVAFALQSDGSYQATLLGLSDPGALSFQLQWQDGAGVQYSSATGTFAAAADQVGTTTSVSQAQITNNSNTAYTISVSTQVPSTYANGLTVVQAQWRLAGSSGPYSATAVAGTTSSGGDSEIYSAVLGHTNPLAAGTYEIVLTGVRADGTSVELDHFDYVVGPSGGTAVTRSSVSWIAPSVGADQLVIIGGQNAPSTRDPQGRIVATDGSTDASDDYAVYYGTDVSDAHTVSVTSTAQTQKDSSGKVVTTGYNIAVQASLGADEAANVGSGGLHLAWRAAGGGTGFSNGVQLASTGTNTFGTTLGNLAAGQYDVEIYYVDAQGNKVIVEWQRIDAATVNAQYRGHSLTVQAQESGGTLTTGPQGVITVTPGVYTGALDVAALSSSLSLNLVATGNAGGSLQTDGLSTGYFTETQYNALNDKIASNAGDGLWRTYGVDGNGNEVQTHLLGDRSNRNYNPANAITTYTAYDARNNKIAAFGAQVEAADGSGPVRAVDRYAYDVRNNVTSHTDALGNTTQYVFNALGTQVEQIDPYGFSTRTRVDQFGNVTAQVSQLGYMTLKFYDPQGNLLKQVNPMGAVATNTDVTTYTYDAFGRKLTETDGLGNTRRYTYDQRDRLTSQTDALGNTESFAYDGRNNRISTLYPLGQRTDEVYDGLGRVIDTIVYLNGQQTHSRSAYDAYGNLISQTDAMGRTQTHTYGAFGRLLADTDQDGNVIAYNYDVYGRKTNAYDPNAVSDPTAASDPSLRKDVQYSYNAAGQITAINDLATGVSTTYADDLLGHRSSEVITTRGGVANRDTTYQYDALGQLVRWADSVTGDNLNTQYDAEGHVVREYTDLGYDPLGQSNGNTNFRYVDHVYAYDQDGRVTSEVQQTTDASGNSSDSILNAYTYDAASNRLTWNNQGVIVTYTYDADGRVQEGDYYTGSDLNQQQWTYDAMGNVLTYTTLKNGSVQTQAVNTYNDENRTLSSSNTTSDGKTQTSTTTYDLSMRITQLVIQNQGNTFNYDYSYFGDGREQGIQAYGDASGSEQDSYDADKVQSGTNLGQGDNQDHAETKSFIADNEGHILYATHDDGKNGDVIKSNQFQYANGNGVGQNNFDNGMLKSVQLDTDSYAPIQNLDANNPGTNLTYTVQQGDSLQGIANQMYGNASLWFVIADANGLSAGETLKTGAVLLIPNTIQSGTITTTNHKVYSGTAVVSSTLPNLRSPPPPSENGCAMVAVIIIIVVIAVAAVVLTEGAASGLLALAGTTIEAASTAATVASFAVAGALVGAAAGAAQQGLLIAAGYQSYDKNGFWTEVGASAAAGFAGGAAQGLGRAAEVGRLAASLTSFTKVAGIAVIKAEMDVAGVVAQQTIESGGKITSWTNLGIAVVEGVGSVGKGVGRAQAAAARSEAAAARAEGAAAGAAARAAAKDAAAEAAQKRALNWQRFSSVFEAGVLPWAQLGETDLRNGQLTAADYATAAGSAGARLAEDSIDYQVRTAHPEYGRETVLPLETEFLKHFSRLSIQALAGTGVVLAGLIQGNAAEGEGGVNYLLQSTGKEVGSFGGKATGLLGVRGVQARQRWRDRAAQVAPAPAAPAAPAAPVAPAAPAAGAAIEMVPVSSAGGSSVPAAAASVSESRPVIFHFEGDVEEEGGNPVSAAAPSAAAVDSGQENSAVKFHYEENDEEQGGNPAPAAAASVGLGLGASQANAASDAALGGGSG